MQFKLRPALLQIVSILFILNACNSTYHGIKRIEYHAEYPLNLYGIAKRFRVKKIKVEYRIYNKNDVLIEIGTYGERGGYTESKWSSIDSSFQIKNINTINYKKLDYIEYFFYDEFGKLKERTLWICRNNNPLYLRFRNTYNYDYNLMNFTYFDIKGDTVGLENMEISYPHDFNQEIFNDKSPIKSIPLTKSYEFSYDKKNRLKKIIERDEFEKKLGYTKYRYINIKQENGS